MTRRALVRTCMAAAIASMLGFPAVGSPATKVLQGVPEYEWWYGCTPTAAGMIFAYWDGKPGFGNLYYGNASTWSGDGNSGTKSMVAGTAHITSGLEHGYQAGYGGSWRNCTSYPNHEANPDCIADFLKTEDGGSPVASTPLGLLQFIMWDNPKTPINESYDGTINSNFVPQLGSGFGYAMYKDAIDADHPMLLNVMCKYWNGNWGAHSVVGYGYQDNMFRIKVPVVEGGQTKAVLMTVGGFAVMDTWCNGAAGADWWNWEGELIKPVIDGSGVEWWPFVEYRGDSWSTGDPITNPTDWMIAMGVEVTVVPEPAALSLLALGWLALLGRKRGFGA